MKLGTRAFDLLSLLLHRQGSLVRKEEIFDRVWEGRIVSDAALTTVVHELRHALKDDRSAPCFIECVYGQGYRFIGGAQRQPCAEGIPQSLHPAKRRRSAHWVLLALAIVGVLFWRGQATRDAAAQPTIAVLPFRHLGAAQNEYLAEGIAEEILGRLAREPALRVTGRTSSWMFKGTAADVREIGRRLDVAYILEGSVQRASDRLAVNVALVRTADGRRQWAQSFSGHVDDVFDIQQRIGASVASALVKNLAIPSGNLRNLRTSGEVYGMYLSARALLRDREPDKAKAAVQLLETAVTADPAYAPAWAQLAAATKMAASYDHDDAMAGAQEQALGHATRALRLAPELAEARGVYAMVLGIETPEAWPHIRRAAELDPEDSDIQHWFASALWMRGDFDRSLHLRRRVLEIDPLFRSAAGRLVTDAPTLGRHDLAREQIKRLDRARSPNAGHIRGHYLEAIGNFAQAIDWYDRARNTQGQTAGDRVEKHIGQLLLALGFADEAQRIWQFDPGYWGLWHGKLPTLREIAERNRHSGNVDDQMFTRMAAKQFINVDRGAELISVVSKAGGSLHLGRPERREPALTVIQRVPLAAMILMQAGRDQEALQLLAGADRRVEQLLSAGNVPSWLFAEAAQIWSLQGRRAKAIAALEESVRRGWLYDGHWGLARISDEPAFRSLRSDPRFERIRKRMAAHAEHQRRLVLGGYLSRR